MYMITDSLTCRPQKNPLERDAGAALGALGDPCGPARASRPRRETVWGHAAGSTAGLPDQNTASGYGHLTRSRPQDSASNPVRRNKSRASRWPAGRLIDLCGSMSVIVLISSASPLKADIADGSHQSLLVTQGGH